MLKKKTKRMIKAIKIDYERLNALEDLVQQMKNYFSPLHILTEEERFIYEQICKLKN